MSGAKLSADLVREYTLGGYILVCRYDDCYLSHTS